VDYEDFEPDPEGIHGPDTRPRDTKIDEAKLALISEILAPENAGVYYGQQIEVLYEDRFYHWITGRALNELAKEGKVNSRLEPLGTGTTIRFYSPRRNRYWTRKMLELKALVQEYSDPVFTHALGRHGEMMFDSAMPLGGFLPTAKNLRSYAGKTWTQTEHNLDRVFERDGIAYGAEIKNTLPYIPGDELTVKIAMCQHLGLTPLFIFRFAPKSYIEETRRQGGFTLVFKYQLYPFGFAQLAHRVRTNLQLPVDCPNAIQEGTIQRFPELAPSPSPNPTPKHRSEEIDQIVFMDGTGSPLVINALEATVCESSSKFTHQLPGEYGPHGRCLQFPDRTGSGHPVPCRSRCAYPASHPRIACGSPLNRRSFSCAQQALTATGCP
jgi:hypothetical protein